MLRTQLLLLPALLSCLACAPPKDTDCGPPSSIGLEKAECHLGCVPALTCADRSTTYMLCVAQTPADLTFWFETPEGPTGGTMVCEIPRGSKRSTVVRVDQAYDVCMPKLDILKQEVLDAALAKHGQCEVDAEVFETALDNQWIRYDTEEPTPDAAEAGEGEEGPSGENSQ